VTDEPKGEPESSEIEKSTALSTGSELNWAVPYSNGGTCGDNLPWVIENCILTISGSGEMTDYVYGQGIDYDRKTP